MKITQRTSGVPSGVPKAFRGFPFSKYNKDNRLINEENFLIIRIPVAYLIYMEIYVNF
jgi:hypothetical protein